MTGRIIIVRTAAPAASCAPMAKRVARVYKITTPAVTAPLVLYRLDGPYCAGGSTLPMDFLTTHDLYQTQTITLSSMAELTEVL